MYFTNKTPAAVDHRDFFNWEFIQDHIYVFARRKCTDNAIKKPLLNIEMCLKVYLSSDPEPDTSYFIVTEPMLPFIKATEVVLWKAAQHNSSRKMSIKNFSELLSLPIIRKQTYGPLQLIWLRTALGRSVRNRLRLLD